MISEKNLLSLKDLLNELIERVDKALYAAKKEIKISYTLLGLKGNNIFL